MDRKHAVFRISLIFLFFPIFALFAQEGGPVDYFMLDDFSGELSAINTEWEGFTDRVMGGKSDMQVVRTADEEGPFMRMSGRVSLENRGGFIQVRLNLKKGSAWFDGSSYKGFRLRVRGSGDSYYIFAKTSKTLLPWKYFSAAIPVTEEWQWVDIPWSSFKGGDYGRLGGFDQRKLKSIAVTAYGKEFNAQLDVAEVGLYR